MCSSKPPGPSAETVALQKEQLDAIARQKAQAETDKKRVGQEEVQKEVAKRKGNNTSGLYGNSRGGFGSFGGGSMFSQKKEG
jgi:hypothetical protein